MFPLFLSSFIGDCAQVNAVAAVADDGSSLQQAIGVTNGLAASFVPIVLSHFVDALKSS